MKQDQSNLEIALSKDTMHTLLDSLPVGVYVLKDEIPLFYNSKFCEMVGYSREDIKTRNLDDLLSMTPGGKKYAREVYEKILNGTMDQFLWDNPLEKPDGNRVVLRGIIRCVTLQGFKAVMITLRDISKQRLAENEAREQTKLFRLIGENSTDFIYVHDQKNVCTYVSPAVERITGYPAEVWSESIPSYVVSGPLRDHAYDATVKAIKTGEKQPAYNIEIKRKDGQQRYLEVNETPIKRNNAVVGIVGVARDITERLDAAKEMQRINDKLEKRNIDLERANTEMESFIYTVSHDLKAPLVTLHGMTERLIRKSADRLDDKGRHYLERIRVNIDRLEDLVLDLLELSRIGRIEDSKEDVEVMATLSDCIDDAAGIIEEKKLKLIVPEFVGYTYYSPKRLRQVFINILTNAAKYRAEDCSPTLTISIRNLGTEWQLEFRDNGRGIDRKFHEKIFQAFQRPGSNKNDDGTGIGLTVAKRIVEYNGGRIWINSELGKGSTFFVTIPRINRDEKENG